MNEPALRIDDVATGALPTGLDDARVCYWRDPDQWWIYLPRAGIGRLTAHTIIEHADGTITAKPSIMLTGAGGQRHGFLERGTWREV
jgi:hypothetical protein